MKAIFFALALIVSAPFAHATVDAHTRVFLVVQDVQSEEFFVERAPLIGCYGIAQGPQLVQFVSDYYVANGIGCGMPAAQVNINALTCAKVVDSEENKTFTGIGKITLDISACAAKNNPKFITMIRTAAKLNFPQKRGEVKLTLIK
jgi:hypothetical protein